VKLKVRKIYSFVTKDFWTALSTFILTIFALVAILGKWILPYPSEGSGTPNVDHVHIGPGAAHWLGTDELGRDLLSRLMYGARSVLFTSLLVVIVAALVGTVLGLLAAFFGGWIDNAIMNISSLFLSFPPLLLSLVAVSLLGPGLKNSLIALMISWWPWYARLIRNEARFVKLRPFVEIAESMGISRRRIIFRHLLPNVTSPLIIQFAADLGTVILAAGSLAFIGLGAQPPAADWGLLVAQGRSVIFDQWWISTFAGLAIFLVVLAFNSIGDVLRDHFDPRRSQ